MEETVVHTQMWWVRNVWLWVWAVKEEKGPGASWGQPGEGSSPQRGLKERQRWWLLSTVPRGLGYTGSTETIFFKPLTSYPERLRLRKGKDLAMGTSPLGR